MNDKVLSLLGLAAKSKNLVSGGFMTEKTVKAGKAFLVIISREASDNTKKMFTNMCRFYKVPLYFYGTAEQLGHSIGKEYRVSIALTDEGLAKNLIGKLECKES